MGFQNADELRADLGNLIRRKGYDAPAILTTLAAQYVAMREEIPYLGKKVRGDFAEIFRQHDQAALADIIIERRAPTVIELVNTVMNFDVLKETEDETYRLLDSRGARSEFDEFNDGVRTSTGGALECFYAYASPQLLDRFSRLYEKATGEAFHLGKVDRIER